MSYEKRGRDHCNATGNAPSASKFGANTLSQTLGSFHIARLPKVGGSTLAERLGGGDGADGGTIPQTAARGITGEEGPLQHHGTIQRMFGRPDAGLVQRKARDAKGAPEGADHAVAAASSSSGSPLPDVLMRKFESVLGHDLGGVRLHTGSDSVNGADAVGARAFTIGNDIHFNRGRI